MTNEAGGSGSEPGEVAHARDELGRTQAEVRRLTTALEDIVALALSAGDARQRTIQMHRRAVAALSGADREPEATGPG